MILGLLLVSIVLACGCTDEYGAKKIAKYTSGKINEPVLSYDAPVYSFTEKQYDNEEYALPLGELPENYRRDILGKFNMDLTGEQERVLLNNGVVIISGDDDRFEHAYSELSTSRSYDVDGKREYSQSGVPIIITTDSVMHLFHIEFNVLLKNIEIQRLSPMLNEFLDKVIIESMAQYNGLDDEELKELSRRNVAYLCVAKKLMDPDFEVPGMVRDEVEQEIKRIEEHVGFYKNELFSKDCPDVCSDRLYPVSMDYKCNQEVKGKVTYEGKVWEFQDLYIQVCSKRCYCEDYSQYVPRGHYTSSDELKQYFKAMMWLGRITFKANGEGWTKQAVLLTDAVKSAKTIGLWDRIYTVTGFFAGASDDLTFYEYDTAVFNLFDYEFDENKELKQQITEKIQSEIRKQRGPKILGGFEFDVAGNLKETTQGLRLIGQRYAIDSHVLSDMVYNNVGVNSKSEDYERVITCRETMQQLSKPDEFYYSCSNMDDDKVKYWNEVCSKAMEMNYYKMCGGLDEKQLYGVCRFMPTGLDVMSALGSKRADEILKEQKISDFCMYDAKNQEMKTLVNSYGQNKWTENLYNTWLWMVQPVLKEKPAGYPNWMRSEAWKNKDLITALSSWAQLRHDTILYVKQSYTRAVMMMDSETSLGPRPIQSKYYGYVEPNPELYARAKYITEFLIQGLDEQDCLTDGVKNSLEQSRDMMARLQEISEKELEGKALSERDYDYIENIDSVFNRIIENLASALTVETNKKPSGSDVETHRNLEGKDDAFKTTIIADVHTETNTKKALEVGTGKIDWILVAHASKDGRVGLAVGPMFSYYEFPWPMKDRLTDEKWREMLKSEPGPKRPEWTSRFIS
ncbi:MAG: hypothetical protein DRN71_02815 [Candidatus Nanohalarchaeota archaeon]|nr:MAG: hypothetical protein DRN71_02815 [Candidatus Nanohaloarchaeota archaeon]